MSYKSFEFENVLISKWSNTEEEDCQKLVRDIQRIYKSQGKPVISINIMTENAPVPTTEFRKAAVHSLKSVRENIEFLVSVLPGDNLKSSILRTAASTMILVSSERGKVKISDSLDSALDELKNVLPVPKEKIIDFFQSNKS